MPQSAEQQLVAMRKLYGKAHQLLQEAIGEQRLLRDRIEELEKENASLRSAPPQIYGDPNAN